MLNKQIYRFVFLSYNASVKSSVDKTIGKT